MTRTPGATTAAITASCCANIDDRVDDVLAWDWPPERFAGMVSVATLHHLPLAEILPRLRGALKPGGVLAVLDLCANTGPGDRLLDALALFPGLAQAGNLKRFVREISKGVHAMGTFKAQIPRELAVQYGEEAVRIIQSGAYRAPSGRIVSIADLIARAVQGTASYPPDVTLPGSQAGACQTRIEVANETTLAAVQRLRDQGHHPAALNFASANHPGGGFLSGARAQEEYLARSSGLYACLRDNPMYAYHRARYDPLYTDYVIYSPEVPVFRADDGALLETPYTAGIITSPAVNAAKLPPARGAEILPAMWSRILKVLAVGVRHGHDSIVLGAWGCGAFGNDGAEIARLFQQALAENFKGAYEQVIFAIVDWSEERRFIGPFERAFAVTGATFDDRGPTGMLRDRT